MKAELRLLNALIGMAYGPDSAEGWPTPLKAYGFRLTAMQLDVAVEIDGVRTIVTPEAVFQSIDEDACLVIESKSATLDDRQARKYWALDARDLIAFGACREPGDPDSHVVAPIYFCSAMHTESLKPQIEDLNVRVGSEIPLVDHDNHRFMLVAGRVRAGIIHALFDGGLYFNENHWPSRFVPFDLDSPDAELVGPVMQELVAALMNPDVEAFTAGDIARGHPDSGSDGCVPFYETLGNSTQKRYRVRIAAMIEQFRGAYLSSDLARQGAGPTWTKDRQVDTGRSTTALLRRVDDFVARVRDGRPLPKQKQVERLVGQEQLEELAAEP